MRRLLLLLALGGCADGVPAETCADLWNADANAANRAEVREMKVAAIAAGRDGGSNTGDPACGAMFRAGVEWMSFVATDNATGSLGWEPGPDVRGSSSAPEGSVLGQREATVRRDGTVALDSRH